MTPTAKSRLSFCLKLLIGLLVVSPIVYALLVSFMQPSDVSTYPPKIIPRIWTLENYDNVLLRFPIFEYLKNSLIVCVIVIGMQVVLSSLAAYAFTYFTFPGRNLLFALVLSTMMIPSETIIIANYLTMCNLGLLNTFLALVLPYTASGMGIFLMRQFYLTIPKDLHEAATIDGCSDWRFMWSVTMPISMPTITALSVYVFVITYNQYMWPLFVTSKSYMRTVQIGVSMLMDAETTNYSNVTAGAILALIPVMMIFVFGQRYLVKGMTSGAVKG